LKEKIYNDNEMKDEEEECDKDCKKQKK
jgi:hypothetical protein